MLKKIVLTVLAIIVVLGVVFVEGGNTPIAWSLLALFLVPVLFLQGCGVCSHPADGHEIHKQVQVRSVMTLCPDSRCCGHS